MLLGLKLSDEKLGAWLRSNPVGECYKTSEPVILIEYPMGIYRWPLVPEQRLRKE
jgi:hypothetical protein